MGVAALENASGVETWGRPTAVTFLRPVGGKRHPAGCRAGWLVGRASATLEGDIHLLNMKGSAIVTIVYSLYSWRGLLVTGSVMSEAADRASVVGFRRLPFIPKRDS